MASILDHQIGFKVETTPGTAVTVDKFLEWTGGDVAPVYPAVRSAAMRPSTLAVRSDRTARPGMTGASGNIAFEVLTKGNLSSLLSLIMGKVTTTGPTDSAYTHTGELADLSGKTATVQKGIVDSSGTVRAFTYAGVKFSGFTISCSVNGLMTAQVDIADAKSETTATALATASYASSAELYHWAQGAVTIGGVANNVTDFSVQCSWPVAPRRFIGNNWAEATITGMPDITVNITVEFDSLTNLAYARSTTAAGAQAKVVGTWTAPSVIGAGTTNPSVTMTLEKVDFEAPSTVVAGAGIPTLQLSGKALFDGTNSPLKIAVVSADVTA